jgi:hypothetical protein
MKFLSTLLALCILVPLVITAQDDPEKESIQNIIRTAYVDGLQNKGPKEAIEKGFHPGFDLLGIRNNELTKWPIYSWIQFHEKKLLENPAPPKKEEVVTCSFPFIDISGNAAVAKVELFKGGEKIFTDYLSLYKFEEGWKIVSKIYFRHSQ